MALTTKPAPKSKPAHKKRAGKHHKHSKNYLKSYWPYIPMLLIVGIGLSINSFWAKGSVLDASSDFTASSLLRDTNEERAGVEQAPLTIDAKLTAAAQSKAEDMAARNYWSHNTPDGSAPWTFVVASGYNYEKAGENLAYGFASADQTITGWMNSPGHRENLLSQDYQNVGFGIANNPNYLGKGPETIIVAMYGRPAGVATPTFTATNNAAAQLNTSSSDQSVSRVALLSDGKAPWSVVVLSTALGIIVAVFITKHGLYWHRLLRRGEHFVVSHPLLDIALVTMGTAAFILTRPGGIIS